MERMHPIASVRRRFNGVKERMDYYSRLVGAKWQVATLQPEAGMATAEYAVVLVAATGFAGLLVTILKSSAVRTLLTGIIKKALNV